MIRILLFAIALGLPGSVFQANQPPSSGVVYIALGDSIAAGIGSSLPRERSFPTLLGRYMEQYYGGPVTFENLARPGETASSFLAGEQRRVLENVVAGLSASSSELVVTLLLGGNEMIAVEDASDQSREEALASFQSSYPEALDAVLNIAGDEARVYVATVYDPTGGDSDVEGSSSWWINRFNSVIRVAAEERELEIVDLAAELQSAERELTRYPVDAHPTNEGHVRIARTHWNAIGLDTTPPQIDLLSSTTQNRRTPTVRFRVSETLDRQSLTIQGGGNALIYELVEIADQEYVALVDASEVETNSLELTIAASDLAGNRTETTLGIEFVVSQ